MKNIAKFAVLRYVPSLEREEFINLGVAIHYPEDQYLNLKITNNFKRLKAFDDEVDTTFLKIILDGIRDEFLLSTVEGFSLKELSDMELLKKFTRFYVNQIQFSEVKTFITNDIYKDEENLFKSFVYYDSPKKTRITKEKVKSVMSKVFTENLTSSEFQKDFSINIGHEKLNIDFLLPETNKQTFINSISFDYSQSKQKNALISAKEWHWNINKIIEMQNEHKLFQSNLTDFELNFDMVVLKNSDSAIIDDALQILDEVANLLIVKNEEDIKHETLKIVNQHKIIN